MGIYAKHVLPCSLLHTAMRQEILRPRRARVAGLALGSVLEIGVGSGLNLPHYGPAAREVTGVDPCAAARGVLALRRARPRHWRAQRRSMAGPTRPDLESNCGRLSSQPPHRYDAGSGWFQLQEPDHMARITRATHAHVSLSGAGKPGMKPRAPELVAEERGANLVDTSRSDWI